MGESRDQEEEEREYETPFPMSNRPMLLTPTDDALSIANGGRLDVITD